MSWYGWGKARKLKRLWEGLEGTAIHGSAAMRKNTRGSTHTRVKGAKLTLCPGLLLAVFAGEEVFQTTLRGPACVVLSSSCLPWCTSVVLSYISDYYWPIWCPRQQPKKALLALKPVFAPPHPTCCRSPNLPTSLFVCPWYFTSGVRGRRRGGDSSRFVRRAGVAFSAQGELFGAIVLRACRG